MTDNKLTQYIPMYGDCLALRAFCRKLKSDRLHLIDDNSWAGNTSMGAYTSSI